MKPIKSTDPRKPEIVSRLRFIGGGTKVTMVRERDGNYEGHVLRPKSDEYGRRVRGWKSLGWHHFPVEELGQRGNWVNRPEKLERITSVMQERMKAMEKAKKQLVRFSRCPGCGVLNVRVDGRGQIRQHNHPRAIHKCPGSEVRAVELRTWIRYPVGGAR